MKSPILSLRCGAVCAGLLVLAAFSPAAHQMEFLQRGLVAVRASEDEIFLSWRLLITDPETTRFNVYRSTGDGPAVKINGTPLADATCFSDFGANLREENTYYVRALTDEVGQPPSEPFVVAADAPIRQYFEIPLNRPADVLSPEAPITLPYNYSANDASVADLDGDGEYEIVVKWDPSNSKDNAHSGVTGNVYLDAYEIMGEDAGKHLWRIDLGRNIRAGAHYTQFMVYDLDGDGKAEVACKTADGTTDGRGAVMGNPAADYRNPTTGYVLEGPEFLTVFNGETGAQLKTVSYTPPRGDYTRWRDGGGGYGNRVDRFLACIAYLDGERPSLVMTRGYYTRTVLAAYDYRDGELTSRWVFDTDPNQIPDPALTAYRGQGAHSLTVGDVDGDGRDEIVFGACTIDDDGTGLYSTGIGHGDALHLSDMDPDVPGLEVWMVHEDKSITPIYGSELHKAATGEFLHIVSGNGDDVGRGVAADIDPRYRGFETWASRGDLHNVDGTNLGSRRPSMNFLCYWDGDLLRELLDGTTISKWDYENASTVPLLRTEGVSSNNGTKANPALSADLFGDWREEVVWRDETSDHLRIYTTTIPTEHRLTTLMQDRQYRLAIAWQNVGYNQPPHPGFYLGDGMSTPPKPAVNLVPAHLGSDSGEERFARYLIDRGLSPDLDPGLDHDGNGYTLFTEYAFASSGGPLPEVSPGPGQSTLIMTVNTPRDHVDYAIDKSTDLERWEHEATIFGGNLPLELVAENANGSHFYRFAIPRADEFNAFPEVTLTAPGDSEEFELDDLVTLTAEASDADGSIASVEFLLDGNSLGSVTTAPYSLDWTVAGLGPHTLRAVATDNLGGKGYSSPLVTITVNDTPSGGPVTYPAENAIYVGPHSGFEAINSGEDPRDFRGTGYINFAEIDAVLTFNDVSGGGGGPAVLTIRYAQGSSSSYPAPRSGVLRINGVAQPIALEETGGWGVFLTTSFNISLNAGETNTIAIETTGNDFANVDEITVTPSP